MLFALCGFATFAQTTETKTVTYFEKYVIDGIKPPDSDVQMQYQPDMRVIVWNDPLIKDYKYSNEAFDEIGYEYVKTNAGDNSQTSKVYRNCSKGIIVEVTKWYNLKLSISIQWFKSEVRPSIGYLMFCESKKQTQEEIAKGVYDLFKEDAIKEYSNKTIWYSDRKNKPQVTEGTTFLKNYYYEIIQKKNPFANECMQLVLNKSGSKEFKTNWQNEMGAEAGEYKTFTNFIQGQLPKLLFTNPKDLVYGDSLLATTILHTKVEYEKDYLGFIKVKYDTKTSTVEIKSKETTADIKNEDIVEFLKTNKSGTYKLSCTKVNIGLDQCYNANNFVFLISFIALKIYEPEDEIKSH